jgi:hypothetical protein
MPFIFMNAISCPKFCVFLFEVQVGVSSFHKITFFNLNNIFTFILKSGEANFSRQIRSSSADAWENIEILFDTAKLKNYYL